MGPTKNIHWGIDGIEDDLVLSDNQNPGDRDIFGLVSYRGKTEHSFSHEYILQSTNTQICGRDQSLLSLNLTTTSLLHSLTRLAHHCFLSEMESSSSSSTHMFA